MTWGNVAIDQSRLLSGLTGELMGIAHSVTNTTTHISSTVLLMLTVGAW